MALRSGYKGFKKLLPGLKIIRPGTLGIDNDVLISEINKTFFPRSEQAVLGAKNLCPFNFTVATPNGITWTIDNGVVDADGTTETGKTSQAINSFIAPFSAQVIINGCNSGQSNVHMFPYDKTDSARPYTDSSKTTRLGSSDNVYTGNEISFYMEEGHEYVVYCRILGSSGTTVTVSHQKFYPMIRLATDTDDTYVPYAMTNRELTDNKVDKVGREITSSDDADNLDSAGRYYWKGTKPANIPADASTYSYMEVYAGVGTIKQIIYSGTNTIYMRIKSGSPLTWKPWYKFEGTAVS